MNAQIGTRKSPNTSTTEIFNQVYRSNPVTFPAVFPAEDDDKHIRFGSAVMSSSRYFENPYATMLNSLEKKTLIHLIHLLILIKNWTSLQKD